MPHPIFGTGQVPLCRVGAFTSPDACTLYKCVVCSQHPFEAAWLCLCLGNSGWNLHRVATLEQVAQLVGSEGLHSVLGTQLWEQPEEQLGEPERRNRNIPSFPRGRGRTQRGADWGLLVYGFSSVSQTSWAGITKQERFVSLAGVWREGILMWFCEQPMDSRRSRYVQYPSHLMPHGTCTLSGCKSK